MSGDAFDLEAVRVALANNLTAIAGWKASPYMQGSPRPPTIEVMGPDEIDYDVTGSRGSDKVVLIVRAFAGGILDVASQKRLDKLLASSGPTSVKAAIEAEPTLGGAVEDLRVTKCSGYRKYALPSANTETIGADWLVELDALGGGL